MQYTQFHGHTIATGTRSAYQAAILQALQGTQCTQVITINPEYVVLAKKQQKFKDLTKVPTLTIPDGIGLTWALQAKGLAVERYPGAELLLDACTYANTQHGRIGVLIPRNSLSSPQEITAALHDRFHQLHVTIFTEGQENLLSDMRTANLQALFVTFGQPQQDVWIGQHQFALPTLRLAVGVGGAFDFLTGKRRRAPRVMQRLGVEWLWRLIRQPLRLPRMLRATFGFWYVILTTK